MGGGAGRALGSLAAAQGEPRMINLRLFPSRRLAFYTVRLFLTRSLAVMIGLVLILMTLDLLGESGKILAVPGNGEPELWQYVSLRIPLLIQRFLPFSVLLGTLIAFVGLNQHSEVVAMKAAGISAHQMLAPIIVASFGIAGIAFAFNETVVVNSARAVLAWSDNDYEPLEPETGMLTNVWVLSDGNLVRARHIGGRGAGFHAEDVTIYERSNGALQRVIDIERATPEGPRWRLDNVSIYDSRMNVISRARSGFGMEGVTAQQLTLARVDPETTSFFELRRKIDEMESAGSPPPKRGRGCGTRFQGPCRAC